VQLVAQSGTQFALGYADDPAGLARVRDDIETACGKPVLIGALTLIEALRALDVGSAVIVGCYYDEAFLAATSTLFEAHGIRVAQASNWVREGRFESQQAVDALHWHYEERWGLDSLETLAAGRLPADCAFVVPGAGIRTVVAADALKAAAGRPVVGGDAAFLWAILRQLNLARSDLARVPGGRLFRML
jgi:maleate cis-trans isomerase